MDPVTAHGWSYFHEPVTGDQLITSGRCILHSITINAPATTAGAMSIEDGVDDTGDVVAIIDFGTFLSETAAGVFTLGNQFNPVTIFYDIQMELGIFLDNPTAVGADITIMFK